MVDNKFRNPSDQWELIRYRLVRFGLTVVVLAACSILYYLGFFGTYDGPLHPQNIGRSLSSHGINRDHVAWFFITLFFVLLTWNWFLNAFCLLSGKRLTCVAVNKKGHQCGARVCRQKKVNSKGNESTFFVCESGHVFSIAHFQPIKKGPWNYCICIAMAMISGMCIYWI